MAPTLTPLARLAKRLHPHVRGWLAEKLALLYYLAHGYQVLAAKTNPTLAQADLTLKRGKTLIITEVKYRTTQSRGHLALHPTQRARLHRQMRALAARHPTYTVRLELMLIFPYWPFLQRIRHVDIH